MKQTALRRILKRHRDRLKCSVVRIEYDTDTHAGRLYMAAGHCCDMTACIALFEAIDPDVQFVRTFSGDQLDTTYWRTREPGRKAAGEWEALLPTPEI